MEFDHTDHAERYPIDFDALQKGDSIPVSIIEHYCGHRHGTEQYAFAVMGLQSEIERRLAERETPVYAVITSRAGELHILKDAEGSECAFRRVKNHAAAIHRNTKRLSLIDAASLTAEQQRAHETRLLVSVQMSGGLRASRREALSKIKARGGSGDSQTEIAESPATKFLPEASAGRIHAPDHAAAGQAATNRKEGS